MQYIHMNRRSPRHPAGESRQPPLRVDFDRRLKLEFHGSKITSDGGLLAYRELDDALELSEAAGDVFADSRTGKNGWHGMTGLFRQSVFGPWVHTFRDILHVRSKNYFGRAIIQDKHTLLPEQQHIFVCFSKK